jgi:hypothetical protein
VIERESTDEHFSQPTNSQSEQRVEVSQGFVIEEVMKKLQALLDQKPKESRWKRFVSDPLFLLIAGVLFTGFVGNRIALVYSTKQNELAAERSFSDELNKLRIQKHSEVWARLDEDEGAIERLLNQPDEPQNPNDKNDRAKQIEQLIQQDRRTVDKARFWLGDQSHGKIHEYLDASSLYAIQKLMGSDDKLEALLQRRKAAKSDLDAERDKSLQALSERSKGIKLFYFF